MIRKGHSTLSLKAQCNILNIHRSGIYYKPRPESDLNLELMRQMDEHYLHHSYKGAPSMYTWLTRDKGYTISRNRVERLYYRCMGLQAVMPGRHTSRRHKTHKVYPYLLRNLQVSRPNQVWAMDITFVPMARGFVFLAAVVDLHSRKVLAWRVSITLDAGFCVEAVDEALGRYGPPEILNTDQGSQFTSEAFTGLLKDNGIAISMDSKGCWKDNVFVERLWKSVKYEEVYLKAYDSVTEARAALGDYFDFYNARRPHSSLGGMTPDQSYTKPLPESTAA